MIPIKISYNDQALPSPMYYFLYPKALESYVDNGGVPPEIGHFLINAFFSYYGIQTPSKNAFLKIIQESEKLYRRMLPVKHFQEKIEQELKKTIV